MSNKKERHTPLSPSKIKDFDTRRKKKRKLALGIGEHVINALGFLRSLSRTHSRKRQYHLLKRATTSELLSLIEIALNIVKGRFRISGRQRCRMMPFANLIRRMSRVRSEHGARQLLLGEQKGGGPNMQSGAGLIPPLISHTFFSALLTPIIIEITRLLSTPATTQTISSK